jgi:1-acyl-sn-glycerol-3-phosphate acyltransferase
MATAPRTGSSGAPNRHEPPAPGPVRYHAVRLVLWALSHAYVHFRTEGRENIPDEPYILCINHPSWLDPVVLAAAWPDDRRLSIFGPRERDMSTGIRNHLITWTRRGVPFQPGGTDILDATRRATAVLRRGDLLVVAGEGRLSDEENRILPLETGVAHFAIQAGVPVLPTAVIGTRWVAFGRTIRFRIGRAVYPPEPGASRGRASRAVAADLTEQIQAELERLLSDVEPSQPPGRVGRLISDAFNDRPWLTDPEWNKRGR